MKLFIILLLMSSPLFSSTTLTFVGDIVLGQDYRFYGKTFDWQYSQLNGSPREKGLYFVHPDLRNLMLNDTVTVGNFEGTMFHSNIKPNPDKKFVFFGKPEYAQILKANGIDVVNVANNHAPYDYGEAGLFETLESLVSQGIQPYGYNFIWGYDEESNQAIRDDGVCICGLEAFGSHNKVKEKIDKYIKKLSEKCNYLVYTFHWGYERKYQHNFYQQTIAEYVIDRGADLVIGHHPHVVQDIEEYKGKKIVYSLGNFIFGGRRMSPKDKEAIMFQVKFNRYGEVDYKVIPINFTSSNFRNDYRVEPR